MLEPIGVALPERLKGTGVSRLVERVREQRKDLPADYSENDIYLVAGCWDLEQHIKKKRYKSALQATARIMESSSHGLQKEISRQTQDMAAAL